jgi:hypothetical protein
MATNPPHPRTIAMVVHKYRLGEEPSDVDYWRSQTNESRLAALEQIRAAYHGWKDDTRPRFERVYTIVKR